MEDQYFKLKIGIICRKSCKPGHSLAFSPRDISFTRNEIWISGAEKNEYLKPISKEEFDAVIAPYLEQSKDPSRDVERVIMKNNPDPMNFHLHSSLEERVEILAGNPSRYYYNFNLWSGQNSERLKALDWLLEIAREYEHHELIARIEEVKKNLTEIYSNQTDAVNE